jgi:subtilase family serine protease
LTKRLGVAALIAASLSLATAATAPAARLKPLAKAAPESALATADAVNPACTSPAPVVKYSWLHCYTAQDIRAAYGVSQLPNKGEGQTIVLVDSYGTPTGAADLKKFHDTFFPGEPAPNYDAVYPLGKPDYKNVGNGQSGSSAAEGWAGEATLDIEWSYAMAPRAHIVLLGVPPAETEGVQGFPNLFKAISDAIDAYPRGTVFSQSFGITEQTFGGAAATQTARFDAVYKKAIDKGDTVLASSGDDGTTGPSKRHRDSVNYTTPTAGWPATSPYVTAVGGTQLQYGWTWTPTSDTAFTADGNYNPAYFAYTNGGNTEPVWNESWLPAASGGGPSAIYPRPSWQDSVAGRIPGNHRAVPDLAWDAAVNGGVLVYTSFFPSVDRVGWHLYGGTSSSSPQVAGLVALINEQQRKAGQPPVGHLAPLLYKIGSNAAAFRDVTPIQQGTALSGNLTDNRLFDYNGDGADVTPGPVPGWPVRTGWDMTTGFGTPKAAGFVAAVRAARNTP